MNLYLSKSTTSINTTFTSSDGVVLYKTHTPFRLVGGRSTTISRALRDIPTRDGAENALRFAHLAQIDWKIGAPTILRFGGQEIKARSYLIKDGWGHRKFTGLDGKEYKWILGANRPKAIALYHRQRFGVFHAKRQAYLEVLPQAEHMLDTVVMTFVYVEKIRRQKEDAAKSQLVLWPPFLY
ncbi:hypothetical protein BDZ89DRAFT_953299 [Hymenopellis radicata]|nr:hypothetical protein BDZ89DRAFT_953299 [Hymenopellis radicata]